MHGERAGPDVANGPGQELDGLTGEVPVGDLNAAVVSVLGCVEVTSPKVKPVPVCMNSSALPCWTSVSGWMVSVWVLRRCRRVQRLWRVGRRVRRGVRR
jgi:hypothetical protein